MKEAADKEQLEEDWKKLDRVMRHNVNIYNKTNIIDGDTVSAWWYDPTLRMIVIEVDIVVPGATMMRVFPDDYVHPEEYEDACYGTFHLEIDVTDPTSIKSICKSCVACFNELSHDKDTARYYTQSIYNDRYEWVFAEPEVYGEYSASTQKGIFDAIENACIYAWKYMSLRYDEDIYYPWQSDGVSAPSYQLSLK